MTKRLRSGPTILTLLAGIVTTFFVDPVALDAWVSLGWRRPIQDWMLAWGAGSTFVGYVGLIYIAIPSLTTATIAGGVIGTMAWKRWWQLSLVYSGTVIALPYLSVTLDGSFSINLRNQAWMIATVFLLNGAVIPATLGGAWLTSKPRRRRDVRRELRLCLTCGYDLTGNESGTCPECGKKVAERKTAP